MALVVMSIFFMLRQQLTYGNGVLYEEVSESNHNQTDRYSMNRMPFIHKSFHQCSIKATCNFVIKNILSGTFTAYNNENEFPNAKTGLRIWKKSAPFVQNCQQAYNNGYKQDGIFKIEIPVIGPSQVRCDLTTQPGGWIVFQRRVDATVDFYRNWGDYKQGFGDLNGNFWLGLEKLHQLAAPGRGATLRVDLKHMDFPGVIKYAEYSVFEISDEADGYKMMVGGYDGDAGDSLFLHNGMKFTTKDIDNDLVDYNCAIRFHGPWWHNGDYMANLNNKFPSSARSINLTFMTWFEISKRYGGIVFSEMKIKL